MTIIFTYITLSILSEIDVIFAQQHLFYFQLDISHVLKGATSEIQHR